MPKDKLDKEFLRQNDLATATERVLEAAKPYSRQIGMAAIALVVIGVGYLVWGAIAERKAAAASALLAESLRVQAAKVEDASVSAEQAAAKALSKAQGQEGDGDDSELKFKTRAEQQAKLMAAFQQARSAPGEIGRVARLGEAGVLLEQGKYAEAEAIYRAIVADSGFALRFLAREGLGYALEGQKKYREALAAYKELEPKEGGFYRDRSLYHQARMYEQLGDEDKAEKLYEQARKLERTPLFEDINVRLTALRARRSGGKAPAGGEKKTDKPADEKKADEKKADEKKAEPAKADDRKPEPAKADDKKAEPAKADDKKPAAPAAQP